MRNAAFLLLCAGAIAVSACRPSNDRVEATESGAAASGGAATSRPTGDPVAKGAEKATPETLPANLAVADDAVADLPNSADNSTVENGSAATPAPIIPTRYRGRWGMVPADCTSTRGDAKGLIRIGERTIRFYESTATLKEQRPAITTSFAGAFSFTGEGQSWEKDITLSVQGDTLTRAEEEGSYTYTRCPQGSG